MKTASPFVLGIDLGGTKSAASLLTWEGEVRDRLSAPTPAAGGPSAIIPMLLHMAQELLRRSPEVSVSGIGISAGAPADARRGLVFEAPNLSGWGSEGIPLADIFAREFGLPVGLENDADATALAEHRFGAGSGSKNMVFLTVGTGVGGGIIADGGLLRGAFGAGGEVGHIPVEPEGRACTCGLRGCLEAYASGPSMVRIARERGFGSGSEVGGPAVIAAARSGDPIALSAVTTAGQMLGRGIAILTMLLNPEIIVLGTLAVHAGDLLLPEIWREVEARTWPRLRQNVKIVPAALGDRAQDLAALCAFRNRQSDSPDLTV